MRPFCDSDKVYPLPRQCDSAGLAALGVHHLGPWVDGIEASIRQFVRAGGELVEPVSTGTTGNLAAFVRGPDGVLIEFLQPPKR